jgi:hypothetical protein
MALIYRPVPKSNKWIKQIFSAAAVAKGAVVRRDCAWVEKVASMKDLETEVRNRRFHMILTGDQCVIICNTGHLQVVC